jgi:RNA polymerase sigma-54 factor
MKPSLQIRLGQSLTMTPQLQQAIRLLQLSTLELQTEIRQALESNPMLEERDDDNDEPVDVDETVSDSDVDSDLNLDGDRIPDELPVDSQWDDVYDVPISASPSLTSSSSSPSSLSADDAQRALENRSGGSESLQEHLRWQLDMTPLSPTDETIAVVIVDGINEEGFLGQSLEEIQNAIGVGDEIGLDEIAAVLKLVQSLDPVGVGARDLRESLLIQLHALAGDPPGHPLALRLVEYYFDLLGRRDFRQLKRRTKVNDTALAEALDLIRSLNPRPGAALDSREAEYISPDVYVRRDEDGEWLVTLNPGATPRVGINHQYAALIRRGDKGEDNTYLKNNLQEARWLLKSLQSRNETLLRVARAIVERQRGFLEQGEEAMEALVLHNIAEQLDLHESTISRVTSNKYMHTPRGVFELKYFFSSHVGTADGGEASSTAIRAMIKRLVGDEPRQKPLSDNKIAGLLSEQGFQVARRTVAKYREAMAIPSSSERKRLA